MIINSQLTGYGDLVLSCLLSESAKPKRIAHCCYGGKATIARMFGQEVCDWREGMFDFSNCIRWESEHPETPRFVARANAVGVPPIVKPLPFSVPRIADRFSVLIFPTSCEPAREYPHWNEVANLLDGEGISNLMLTEYSERRFPKAVSLDWLTVAGLILNSCLTVGNDSGGVQIAGGLNRPALAVMSPSLPPSIYWHLPTISVVQGILSAIQPDTVQTEILKILDTTS